MSTMELITYWSLVGITSILATVIGTGVLTTSVALLVSVTNESVPQPVRTKRNRS